MAGPLIAVIGAGSCDARTEDLAHEVGRRLAEAGCVLVTGGLGGVMEAASRGSREAGGLVIGILPGADPRAANAHVEIPIATGLGDARNALIANTAQAFIAVGGAYGTLSEIAFALKREKPLVALACPWAAGLALPQARGPREALSAILASVAE